MPHRETLGDYLALLDESTRKTLIEIAGFLDLHKEEFKREWVRLYRENNALSVGPDDPVTSQVIPAFVDLFVSCVRTGDFVGYFAGINTMGTEAAQLGISYGSLMMAIHNYEEVTTPVLMSEFVDRERLRIILTSLDRIYHASIALIASAYLRDTYEEVIRQKQFAETVINVSPDGILIVNDEVVTHLNPAMERLTGFRSDELIGLPCRYALGAVESSGASLCDGACPLLTNPEVDPEPVESRIITKDGREIWMEVRYGLMRDKGGKLTGVVHSFRDITERKQAEQLREQLLSVASHELRTPITSVKGYAQLLQRRMIKQNADESTLHSLDVMVSQLDRMSAMINDLLELSRIQADRAELNLERVDLAYLVKQIIDRLQITTDKHTLTLLFGGETEVMADQFRIEQVMTNLVMNAIKYSPDGGRIEIAIEPVDSEIKVSVKDRGLGIPPEKLDRVFEQFYQVKSDGHRAQGMGLGLFISKEIIEGHGGQIGVESEPGKGSTFYFTLRKGC